MKIGPIRLLTHCFIRLAGVRRTPATALLQPLSPTCRRRSVSPLGGTPPALEGGGLMVRKGRSIPDPYIPDPARMGPTPHRNRVFRVFPRSPEGCKGETALPRPLTLAARSGMSPRSGTKTARLARKKSRIIGFHRTTECCRLRTPRKSWNEFAFVRTP
jgi:hypothetical protein